MISSVYDTNVIVAGLLDPDGLTASLLDLATQDRVRLFVSPALIAEYRMVLLRPKFSLSKARVDIFLRTLRARSHEVYPAFTLKVLRDPANNRVLECAVAARVDYLVTGNTRHFAFRSFRGVKIASPRQFWEAYVKGELGSKQRY